MEKNNNTAFNNHDVSLQLRSKEVSEVMGNIPSWVGMWGTFLIFLLFTVSMLFLFNIHCIQRISGKAIIMDRPATGVPVSQDYFLQVTMPTTEYNKIEVGQKITLSFNEESNSLNKLTGIRFMVDNVTVNTDSCVLWLAANRDVIEKTLPYNSSRFNRIENCELALDVTVFEKVFGSLF